MPSPAVFNAATSQWVHAAAISNPAGGATVDTQSRTAVNGVLAALRAKGVIAGATHANLAHTNQGQRNVLGGAVADPTAGATVDANARTTINNILAVLRQRGCIAGSDSLAALVLDEDTYALANAAIADVTAGGTTDTECRTAVNAALAAMRKRGLIAQD